MIEWIIGTLIYLAIAIVFGRILNRVSPGDAGIVFIALLWVVTLPLLVLRYLMTGEL